MSQPVPPTIIAREPAGNGIVLVRFLTPDLGIMEATVAEAISGTEMEINLVKIIVGNARELRDTVRAAI